jgi:hypothetical protein
MDSGLLTQLISSLEYKLDQEKSPKAASTDPLAAYHSLCYDYPQVHAAELCNLNSAWLAHLQGKPSIPAPKGLQLTNKFVEGLLYCTTSYTNQTSGNLTQSQNALVVGPAPSAEDYATLCYVVFVKQIHEFIRWV